MGTSTLAKSSSDWTGWDLRFILSTAYTGDITYRIKKDKLLSETLDPWVEYTVTLTAETTIECNLNWLIDEFNNADDEAALKTHQYEIWLPSYIYATSIKQDSITNRILLNASRGATITSVSIYNYLTYRLIVKNQTDWNSYTSRDNIATQYELLEGTPEPDLTMDEGNGVIVPSYPTSIVTSVFTRPSFLMYIDPRLDRTRIPATSRDGWNYINSADATDAQFGCSFVTGLVDGGFTWVDAYMLMYGTRMYPAGTMAVGYRSFYPHPEAAVWSSSVVCPSGKLATKIQIDIGGTHILQQGSQGGGSCPVNTFSGGITNTITSPANIIQVTGDKINTTHTGKILTLTPGACGWIPPSTDTENISLIDFVILPDENGVTYNHSIQLQGWPFNPNNFGGIVSELGITSGWPISWVVWDLQDIFSPTANSKLTVIDNEPSYWEKQASLATKYLNQIPETIAEVVEGGFSVTDNWDTGKYKIHIEAPVADRLTAKAIKLRYDFREPKP